MQSRRLLYPDFSESTSTWEKTPVRSVMRLETQLVGDGWSDSQLLSLTKQGVISRDIESGVGKYPASFEGYQYLETDDLVFCLFDVEETPRTIGRSTQSGMITAAYTRYRVDRKRAEPKFLEWYFLALDDQKRYRPFYSGLRNTIPKNVLSGTRISLPPLPVQKAIAEFLDRETAQIDNLIAKQKQLIATLLLRNQQLIRAKIFTGLTDRKELVDTGLYWCPKIPATWSIKPLWMVLRFTTGWTPPSKDDDNYSDDFPWANISDLGGKVLLSTEKGLSAKAVKESNSEISPKGSLLFSFKLSVGKVSIAGIDCYTNEAIATFQPSEKLDVRYSYYMLPVSLIENAVENIYGAKLLNAQRIKNARILIPPIHEQIEIASYLDNETTRTDALIHKAEQAITLLNERRQALISSAVTGKISVGV